MISRRKVAKMLGMAPVALGASQSIGETTSWATPAVGGWESTPSIPSGRVHEPLMTKEAAMRLILNRKGVRNEFESALYESHYHVQRIDPDLAALKSFSQMAKVTFQRQRLVAQAMKVAEDEDASYYHKINNVTETMLRKLMWGE